MTDTLQRAVEVLAREMKPRKIILFGSTARGEAGPDSDIDLLVVLERLDSRFAEMNRASALLASLRIDADVLVYSQSEVEQWGEVVNHVINEALLDGQVVYDAA
jgi:predicted nucleotidyltransferase